MYLEEILIISGLPVLLLGMYIYAKDRNKEPKSLLFKLLLGGVGSTFLVFFISFIISLFVPGFFEADYSNDLFKLFIYTFFGIALVEEGCKWFFAYKISYHNKEFDEFFDMIVYCVFVALGFALFENILYVASGGLVVGITRAFLAVPGHVADGIFMGYFLAQAKYSDIQGKNKEKHKFMILSIIIPTILHGTYDFLLSTKDPTYIAIFFLFVIILFSMALIRVKKSSQTNTNFYYQTKYCSKCGTKVTGNYCSNCGNKITN